MDMVFIGVIINVMLVVVKVKGKMIIENVVCELEIIDIVILLNNMGVKVWGVGMDVIWIEGVEELYGCCYLIILDWIEVGIYLVMVVVMGEGIKVWNVIYEYLESFIVKL